MTQKNQNQVLTAQLQKLDIQMCKIKVEGISPLIEHRWDEKTKKQILDKQRKITVKREAKDPEREFKESLYQFEDGRYGFPADGFKKSMIRGSKSLGFVMRDLYGGFFVIGEYCQKNNRQLVEIKGSKPVMREDMVPIANGNIDIRYRGMFEKWTAEIVIEYDALVISFDQLVNITEAAGWKAGIGEWRPNAPKSPGEFGRFKVLN